MPMNAYSGATGAGKTYQVMEHLICKELAQGRSMVTNIEGIDVDGIYWYILCKNRDEKKKSPSLMAVLTSVLKSSASVPCATLPTTK